MFHMAGTSCWLIPLLIITDIMIKRQIVNKQELKAVSLQIAVGIIGNLPGQSIEPYLSLAKKVEEYLNPPSENRGGTVTEAPMKGL
jgi:hypothetical protein